MALSDSGFNFEYSYKALPQRFYSVLNPTPIKAPKMVLFNDVLAKELSLNRDYFYTVEGIDLLSGHCVEGKMFPFAQSYAGHQFGQFTMLGDGRAIMLGEHVTPNHARFDIQLKGAGKTPYSRGGDGRGTLSSMLREYIVSEALYYLGVPTTRALSITASQTDSIIRMVPNPVGVLTRTARAHIRVGTFEYAKEFGGVNDLKALADYTLKRLNIDGSPLKNAYLTLLETVIDKQAYLISQWQQIGFVHGVMNTDNMALSGETIDYGPCAFLDTYKNDQVFSSIDYYGRYSYANQPHSAQWNLSRLANTLLPLIDKNHDKALKLAQEALSNFYPLYQSYWLTSMRKKLGLVEAKDDDIALIQDLLSIMETYKMDYTDTFIALTYDGNIALLCKEAQCNAWFKTWQKRLAMQDASKARVSALMKKNNPCVIPRNHIVDEFVNNAQVKENDARLKEYLDVLMHPYEHTKKHALYNKKPLNKNRPHITYCGT